MSRADLELVPVVDPDGALTGVLTERALARRYIRESRRTSTLEDAPAYVSAIAAVLEGEIVCGDDQQLSGRVWVQSMDARTDTGISAGDVVVVGNRTEAQLLAINCGAELVVLSNSVQPSAEVLDRARERGTAIVISPLDSYVSGRMITLAAPCRALMEHDPLTVPIDFLVDDMSEQIKELHYGAAVVVDADHRPVGLITRADLVAVPRRQVILVDHAEQAQSVLGIDQAEIVEILDHHHIGSIETRVPVTATFDPVGSTATLVVERFRQNGMEPSRSTAMMLLGAVLSDTVILNSATTTQRDHAVVDYLERVLAVDAHELGREMFESTADVSEVSAEEIIIARRQALPGRAAARRSASPRSRSSAAGCSSARTSCWRRCARSARTSELALYALMVTDVLEKGTEMLVAGRRRRGRAELRRRADRRHHRPAGRDEPQEGSRAEADDGAVAGAQTGVAATWSAGASPHSCSSR